MQEADLLRIELAKRRREREVADSAAFNRERETTRLAVNRSRQEKESAELEEERPSDTQVNTPSIPLSPRRSMKASSIRSNVVAEPKVSEPFKFTTEKAKKASSRLSMRRAAPPETEPLYREETKVAPTVDDCIKTAIKLHPKLFEVSFFFHLKKRLKKSVILDRMCVLSGRYEATRKSSQVISHRLCELIILLKRKLPSVNQ